MNRNVLFLLIAVVAGISALAARAWAGCAQPQDGFVLEIDRVEIGGVSEVDLDAWRIGDVELRTFTVGGRLELLVTDGSRLLFQENYDVDDPAR
jgi:hypothetical protein